MVTPNPQSGSNGLRPVKAALADGFGRNPLTAVSGTILGARAKSWVQGRRAAEPDHRRKYHGCARLKMAERAPKQALLVATGFKPRTIQS
jgi:hypothetical protein